MRIILVFFLNSKINLIYLKNLEYFSLKERSEKERERESCSYKYIFKISFPLCIEEKKNKKKNENYNEGKWIVVHLFSFFLFIIPSLFYIHKYIVLYFS